MTYLSLAGAAPVRAQGRGEAGGGEYFGAARAWLENTDPRGRDGVGSAPAAAAAPGTPFCFSSPRDLRPRRVTGRRFSLREKGLGRGGGSAARRGAAGSGDPGAGRLGGRGGGSEAAAWGRGWRWPPGRGLPPWERDQPWGCAGPCSCLGDQTPGWKGPWGFVLFYFRRGPSTRDGSVKPCGLSP